MSKIIDIPGRFHSTEQGNIVAGANEIYDDSKGKKQNTINAETDAAIESLSGTSTELSRAIEAILALIPSAASALNKLADVAFVNSSIATASATFRGTYNLVTDLDLPITATHQQIATALASAVSTADNNDYAFVQVPVSESSTEIRVTERYKFDGTAWLYEYDLNNSGFTAAQWEAINSAITSVLVAKLSALPTASELATQLAGKQNVLTLDNAPVSGSSNPVKSGGLYEKFTAIDAKIPSDASADNKLVAENRLAAYVGTIIEALDASFNLTSADGHVTFRLTQADGQITSVQIATDDIASAAALTALSGRVSTNERDIDALQEAYVALTQSDIVVVDGALPSSGQQQNIIYRQPDQDHTPPQFYSDYMWNGTTWVLMGQYNNAIDPRPKKGSKNLVTSGGVFDNMSALDVSELNATENPHALATYADLSAALAAIPSDYQKGGMSIKFVLTSDNKYIQARLMANAFTTDVTAWQGVDREIVEGSHNLIESGAVEKKTGNIISKDGVFTITDENGYIGAVIDGKGLSVYDVLINVNGSYKSIKDFTKEEIEHYFIESECFYITDENGYIAFEIDKNGNIISVNSSHESQYAGRIEVPSKINVLQDSISELYYEQMLGCGFLRDYMLEEVEPYRPQLDRMQLNTASIGPVYKKLFLYNTFGETIESKDITVNVVNKSASGNLKICVIGDSMTENPKKLLELANLAAKDNNLSISFVGSKTATGTDSDGNTRTIKHCGYSGLNIINICQSATLNGETNPFYDSNISSTNKFSIAKGITNMGDTPDIVIIDMGANQHGQPWSDVKGCYDFIIADIKAYNTTNNTDIKVIVCVQQPGGLSPSLSMAFIPNKWGRNWSSTKLMDYVNEYDNRENEGIYLLPEYLIIDPYKDYPRADVPQSTRNTSLREVALDNIHMGINMNMYDSNHVYSYGEICTDGNQNGYVSLKNNNTEPLSDDKINWAKTKDDVNAGYWKLADAYFAELKYISSL